MKTIAATFLALSLCACATGMTAAQRDALVHRLDAQYGARCEARYERNSDDWAQCVYGFYQVEQQNRAAAVLGSMPAIQPVAPAQYNPPRSVDCTTVNYGGIIKTNCQ